MEEVKLLESHYNATYEAVQLVWAQRNRVSLYAYLLALALVSTELQRFLAVTILKVEKIDLSLPHLLTLGLLTLLGLWVLLTQRTLFLDKQYIYLGLLEKQMEYLLGFSLITREGKFYRLQDIPAAVKQWTPPFHFLYDGGLVILTIFAIMSIFYNSFCLIRQNAGEAGLIIATSIAIFACLANYFISRRRMKTKTNAMADLLFENFRQHHPKPPTTV